MVLQLQRLGILTLQPLQIVYCVCVGMHTDVFGMLCGCVGVQSWAKTAGRHQYLVIVQEV